MYNLEAPDNLALSSSPSNSLPWPQSMQQQIQNLVSSGFVTDHASVRFNESYSAYTASANTVVAKLTEIQNFLKQTANVMRDMDAQIASRIS